MATTTKTKAATKRSRNSELKKMLEDRRRDLAHDVRGKIRDARTDSTKERDVLDQGESSEIDIQDEIEFALIQMKAETLNKIDAALRRLEEGTYGQCFECGDEIAKARLRALPFAVRCKDCEEARETAEQRERIMSAASRLLSALRRHGQLTQEHAMAKVAINGLGRIGRATLKIVMDTPGLDLVAANDLGASDNVVYLLKYDTVYGRYEKTVEAHDDGTLTVGEHRLTLLREENPARLPWKSLNVDIVFECTGAFTRREDLDAHIRAGARYVILSAPSKSDDVETIVHGVNTPQGGTAIISCASCTTNCITPVMEILGRRIGVKKAIMTTVHAYTASQAIVDAPHTHARQRPGRRCEPRSHVHWRGGRDHQSATRISWPIRWRGRPGARPCRIARRHRRPRGKTDDGGRGEPCVYGGGRERTVSRGPRCDHGSRRLVRHHQRFPRVGCGSRHDAGRRW